jgi:hypothetical protein
MCRPSQKRAFFRAGRPPVLLWPIVTPGEAHPAAGVAPALELRISVMAITAWGPRSPQSDPIAERGDGVMRNSIKQLIIGTVVAIGMAGISVGAIGGVAAKSAAAEAPQIGATLAD